EEHAILVPAALPAVVHHDILIARLGHAVGRHRLSRVLHHILGEVVAAHLVPAVPTHRRSECQIVLQCRRRGRGPGGHTHQETRPDYGGQGQPPTTSTSCPDRR